MSAWCFIIGELLRVSPVDSEQPHSCQCVLSQHIVAASCHQAMLLFTVTTLCCHPPVSFSSVPLLLSVVAVTTFCCHAVRGEWVQDNCLYSWLVFCQFVPWIHPCIWTMDGCICVFLPWVNIYMYLYHEWIYVYFHHGCIYTMSEYIVQLSDADMFLLACLFSGQINWNFTQLS